MDGSPSSRTPAGARGGRKLNDRNSGGGGGLGSHTAGGTQTDMKHTPQTQRNARMAPPPVPVFHSGAIKLESHHAAAASSTTVPAAAAASSSSSIARTTPGKASSTPFPYSSFYAAFFLPLTFYRRLDCRWEVNPIMLRRTIKYGMSEWMGDRRKRAKKQQQLLVQQMKKRSHQVGGSRAAAAALSAAMQQASQAQRTRQPRRPYVHPDDLLGLKLAAAQATDTPGTSSPAVISRSSAAPSAASSSSPCLTHESFDSSRVSKRLHLTVRSVTFRPRSKESEREGRGFQSSTASSSFAPALPSTYTPPRASLLHVVARVRKGKTDLALLSETMARTHSPAVDAASSGSSIRESGSISYGCSSNCFDSNEGAAQFNFASVNFFLPASSAATSSTPPAGGSNSTATVTSPSHHDSPLGPRRVFRNPLPRTLARSKSAVFAPSPPSCASKHDDWTARLIFSTTQPHFPPSQQQPVSSASSTARKNPSAATADKDEEDGVDRFPQDDHSLATNGHSSFLVDLSLMGSSSIFGIDGATTSSDPSSPQLLTLPIVTVLDRYVVGEARVELRWTYKVHSMSTTSPFSASPGPGVATAAATATMSSTLMLFHTPTSAATPSPPLELLWNSVVPSAAAAAAIRATKPKEQVLVGWTYAYPSSAAASTTLSKDGFSILTDVRPIPSAFAPSEQHHGGGGGRGGAAAAAAQHAAALRETTPVQHEYHSHFGCALCGMTEVHITTFSELLRHLHASHGSYLFITGQKVSKLDLGLGSSSSPGVAGTSTPTGGAAGPAAREKDKDGLIGPAANSPVESPVPSLSSTSASPHSDKGAPNGQVVLYELILHARHESTNLLPIILSSTNVVETGNDTFKSDPSIPPQATSDTFTASEWLLKASDSHSSSSSAAPVLKGLPRAFIDGWRARVAREGLPGPVNSLTVSTDLPTSTFVFVGERYGGMVRSRSSKSRNVPQTGFGLALSQNHVSFAPSPNANAVVAVSGRSTPNNAAATSSPHALAFQRDLVTNPPTLQPTVKSLLAHASTFAQRSPNGQTLGSSLSAVGPPGLVRHSSSGSASSSRGGPMISGLPTPRERTRPQSRSSIVATNSALYQKQWYHASSGVPLALCELGYDSDEEVDEEWFIQRNGEDIEEFEDVSLAEKSFMKLWNEFILRKSSTTQPREAIYADYLFPSVCASFARTCAPLLRPRLRSAFLSHLLVCWEFGILESSHIEVVMRVLDSSSIETPVRAGELYASFHAPIRSLANQTTNAQTIQAELNRARSPRKLPHSHSQLGTAKHEKPAAVAVVKDTVLIDPRHDDGMTSPKAASTRTAQTQRKSAAAANPGMKRRSQQPQQRKRSRGASSISPLPTAQRRRRTRAASFERVDADGDVEMDDGPELGDQEDEEEEEHKSAPRTRHTRGEDSEPELEDEVEEEEGDGAESSAPEEDDEEEPEPPVSDGSEAERDDAKGMKQEGDEEEDEYDIPTLHSKYYPRRNRGGRFSKNGHADRPSEHSISIRRSHGRFARKPMTNPMTSASAPQKTSSPSIRAPLAMAEDSAEPSSNDDVEEDDDDDAESDGSSVPHTGRTRSRAPLKRKRHTSEADLKQPDQANGDDDGSENPDTSESDDSDADAASASRYPLRRKSAEEHVRSRKSRSPHEPKSKRRKSNTKQSRELTSRGAGGRFTRE